MNAKSATSGGAPWRVIQSRKSSSLSARKPRSSVSDAVGEHPAHDGGHHRDEVPRAPQVGVVVDQLAQRVVGRGERAVERADRRRDAGAVERAAQLRGGLEDRGQHGHAEPARARTSRRRVGEPLRRHRVQLVGQRLEEVRDQLQRAAQDVGEGELAPGGIRLAGQQVVRGELPEPVVPTVAAAVLEPHRLRRGASPRARSGSAPSGSVAGRSSSA